MKLKYAITTVVMAILAVATPCQAKSSVPDSAVIANHLSATQTTIPLPYNPELINSINKQQRKAVPHDLLQNANTIANIIEELGMPSELKFLPACLNTGDNTRCGDWSLTPIVAIKYGLEVTNRHDERFATEASTRAAMAYLTDLYKHYGDWWKSIMAFASMACNKIKDGDYTLHILTTNDVHGSWFDSTYTDGNQKKSLFALSSIVNRFRDSVGEDNVILIDAGDCLQGDNAPFYFNYVDTVTPHLFPRLVSYMKYDAVCVGNHDIETGHPVYDRVRRQLEAEGIPFLGGNAIINGSNDNEDRYFQTYRIIERGHHGSC